MSIDQVDFGEDLLEYFQVDIDGDIIHIWVYPSQYYTSIEYQDLPF